MDAGGRSIELNGYSTTCESRSRVQYVASPQLERPLEMAEFDTEPGKCREGVDDEPTAVACVVVALVGIRPCLGGAVDTDWVRHPFVFSPGMRLAHLCTGR
jgi:hypothetical protein